MNNRERYYNQSHTSFSLAESEVKTAEEFIAKQYDTIARKQVLDPNLEQEVRDRLQKSIDEGNPYPYGGSIEGGFITYSFTPNAVAYGVTISCSATGEKLDITDYDLW